MMKEKGFLQVQNVQSSKLTFLQKICWPISIHTLELYFHLGSYLSVSGILWRMRPVFFFISNTEQISSASYFFDFHYLKSQKGHYL